MVPDKCPLPKIRARGNNLEGRWILKLSTSPSSICILLCGHMTRWTRRSMETCLQLRQAIGFAMRGKALLRLSKSNQRNLPQKHNGFSTAIKRQFLHTKASLKSEYQYMGVSYKWWYPQNTSKWSFSVGKPMVVGYIILGNPHITKPSKSSKFGGHSHGWQRQLQDAFTPKNSPGSTMMACNAIADVACRIRIVTWPTEMKEMMVEKSHPGRLSWNLQITHSERNMIFQTSIFWVPCWFSRGVLIIGGFGLKYVLILTMHSYLIIYIFQLPMYT